MVAMNHPPMTSQQAGETDGSHGLKILDEQMTTQMLRRIYCDSSRAGKWEDPSSLESLRKCFEDKLFRLRLVHSVLAGGQLGKFNMKLLHCACVTHGLEKTAQLFARFIHLAQDSKQLTNFLSFALTVIPHLCQQQAPNEPSVMTMAVRYTVVDAHNIEEELRDNWATIANNSAMDEQAKVITNGLERNFIKNLLTLVKWQEQSEPGTSLKHISLNLADLRGDLHQSLLGYALDYTDSMRKNTGGSLEQESAELLKTFFALMMAIVPQVQLSLSYQNNLLIKISALAVSMLKLITNESLGISLDGIELFARCCTLSGRIFVKQKGASQTQLLRALLDEVFANYTELFGNDGNGNAPRLSSREAGARLDYSKFSKIDFLNPQDQSEHSIFKELRKMGLEEKSAASVAHSGTLLGKRPYKRALQSSTAAADESAEPCQIRRLLIVDFVEQLCLAGKQSTADKQSTSFSALFNSEMCRYLGKLLIDRFSGDGLTSHMRWFPWEQERELIAQYIEVAKSLDKHPLVFDFLLLLSDSGFQGICFVLPLIKAIFVATLGQLENTPLKTTSLVSVASLQRCTQILALLASADFFTDILTILHKLLCQCNNHEAFVLMRDLWEFLQSVIPSPEELDQQNGVFTIDQTSMREVEGSRLVSTMVLVIQRNITSLGSLMPALIPLIDEKDDDDWSIERDPKPISISAEIKR